MGYYECSAKDMTGMKDIFDEAIRTVINVKILHKKIGKYCWSTSCRHKLSIVHRNKCHRCRHFYCSYCIEIWEDGFKGCSECVLNEKEARKRNNSSIPAVKKAGKTGRSGKDDSRKEESSAKITAPSTQTMATPNLTDDSKATKSTTSEVSSKNESTSVDSETEDSQVTDEPQINKRTKVVGGIKTGNLLIESDDEDSLSESAEISSPDKDSTKEKKVPKKDNEKKTMTSSSKSEKKNESSESQDISEKSGSKKPKTKSSEMNSESGHEKKKSTSKKPKESDPQ
eukprot:TRINITY_DN5402_c0_g1_i3.p1 TRINITY_DN5402_c0_g1~~TRINITY_DN5402_c0_g1_i3.p1  ORF type:complete len:284 (-),score=59.60 TRINITY_DN5402_c0_g1_i3:36-887(-)